jgi:hypothetical protein
MLFGLRVTADNAQVRQEFHFGKPGRNGLIRGPMHRGCFRESSPKNKTHRTGKPEPMRLGKGLLPFQSVEARWLPVF